MIRSLLTVVWLNANEPLSVWPATLRRMLSPAKLRTRVASLNWRTTSGFVGIDSVSLTARPQVLMRMLAPPPNVTPGTPRSWMSPEATITNASLPAFTGSPPGILITPNVAFESSTPRAAGLIEPSGIVAGPWPRKMLARRPPRSTWALGRAPLIG